MRNVPLGQHDIFEIGDSAEPPPTWNAEQCEAVCATIGNDIQALMCAVAEKEFALGQQQAKLHGVVEGFLLRIIEVLDAFERVFASIHAKSDQVNAQMKKWIGNFRAVHSLLRKILENHGVSRIESLDQTFDPTWHRVRHPVYDLSRAEGTIVQEIVSGYLWQNQALRKSEVVVVTHSEEVARQAASESVEEEHGEG